MRKGLTCPAGGLAAAALAAPIGKGGVDGGKAGPAPVHRRGSRPFAAKSS